MAADIHQFFVSHKLTSGVNLLGHSMGGKAVMALALNSDLNRPLRSLISVDMSPARGKISPEWVLLKPTADAADASERFASYTDAMMDIETAQVKTKQEADVILQKTEPVRIACFFFTDTCPLMDSTWLDSFCSPVSPYQHSPFERSFSTPHLSHSFGPALSCHSSYWGLPLLSPTSRQCQIASMERTSSFYKRWTIKLLEQG